jgi:hypothetical protein
VEQDDCRKQWRAAANGRLKFELAGLSFALKNGFTPEEYAKHLWTTGAEKWMHKPHPTAQEYILHEAAAFKTLYPDVTFTTRELPEGGAELLFPKGCCLGGWGKDQWAMAKNLGVDKGSFCRYCNQAFRSWSEQLGLEAHTEPDQDGTCVLRASVKNS